VDVAAQPCDRPTRSLGLGVVVADGIVATAAHTVEGRLRALTVDDVPAQVVALDARTDLALLAADLTAAPTELATGVPDIGTVITADGPRDARIVRTGPLLVHDTTDGERYERQVHTFTPGVDDGTSGAPLVDADARLLGIVVLDNPSDGVAYAVTSGEVAALLDGERQVVAPVGCAG
jgi:S1-C subfamily serine protease